MIALGHNINKAVVVMANIRAIDIWKINYLVLSDDNCTGNDLFCYNNSMLGGCPNGTE